MVLTKDQAKEDIQKIINKYERIKSEGKLKQYNEEMTKKDFILPIFRALGWDVDDSAEVSAEEKVSKGRADYSFRLNNITKFFLEAKKLSENLDDPRWSEQAISYSWHKGVAWAVLCDFEGIKVFNAEYKTDNPVLFDLTYDKYLSNFEQLWLLSKESFQNKAIDIEAEKWKKKPKREKIDKALFEDLTKWRSKLLSSIKKLNSSYTEDEADETVQRIIARFVFIRVCEDRELEESRLLAVIREDRGAIAKNLRKLFEYYRNKYDSKIFAIHSADKVSIDDNVLTEVIQDLTGSKEAYIKYDFNAINADVLGTIYEQYLGYILKKVGKGVTVAKGKTHRKEMGIYYTPTYIVEYIVKNTVREYCKDKTLEQISKIRVLDPACGSGSFLIKAFDELSAIIKERIKRGEKYDIYDELTLGGELLLGQKIQIACRNIYGVDLDPKAVEIAQLSILLKLLENEGKDHKGGKLLPTILNVRCGNSLIDDSAIAGDKAFKWEEQFKDVFKEGGFDVVIGNPPYVNIYVLSENKKDVEFFQKKFQTAHKKFDLYTMFMEASIKKLKLRGKFSFIVPDKWLYLPYGEKLRPFILEKCIINKLVDLTQFKVFKDAINTPIIFVFTKETNKAIRENNKIQIITPKESAEDIIIGNFITTVIPQITFQKTPKNMFRIQLTEKALLITNKIDKQSIKFGEICYLNWGCRPVPLEKYYINKKLDENHKPAIKGENIFRYRINYTGKFLNYVTEGKDRLYNPVFPELFERESIIIKDIGGGKAIYATINDKHYYNPHTVINCIPKYDLKDIKKFTDKEIEMSRNYDLKYLLGLINSKLTLFYFRTLITDFLHTVPDSVRALPVVAAKSNDQQPIIKLVDKMLSLNKELNELGNKKTDRSAELKRKIEETDAEIDKLVYTLYGITKEEKNIIEESLK